MKSLKTICVLAIIFIVFIIDTSFTINKNNEKIATEGNVTFSVRTVTNNGPYSPKHVLAIWVEDATGNFVKTSKIRAASRIQYLYSWNSASSGNTVDAISGATLNSHTTHTATWDCKDLRGNFVQDGDYKMYVEFTEAHAQGPITSVTFNKGTTSLTLTPAEETYFKDITLDYACNCVSIKPVNPLELSLINYPNPFKDATNIKFHLKNNSDVKMDIVNIKGEVVSSLLNEKMISGEHTIKWNAAELPSGIYFVNLVTDNNIATIKTLLVE